MHWYNFRTQTTQDCATIPEPHTDYIWQCAASQNLYALYVEWGYPPAQALEKVLEAQTQHVSKGDGTHG